MDQLGQLRRYAQGAQKREIAKEVERGDMPPWYYVPLHASAKLSAQERALIVKWVTGS
ncbi:MAG TPA: heme-binding domain-containing protein [Candidatus Limnocylindrales bacterium]|nr:heme-binding domain-containing protein [Candidatus Limnocylindrales bacterium]